MGIRLNQKVMRGTSGEQRGPVRTSLPRLAGLLPAPGSQVVFLRAESATLPLFEVWQSHETGLTDLQLVQEQQPCPTGSAETVSSPRKTEPERTRSFR